MIGMHLPSYNYHLLVFLIVCHPMQSPVEHHLIYHKLISREVPIDMNVEAASKTRMKSLGPPPKLK